MGAVTSEAPMPDKQKEANESVGFIAQIELLLKTPP